MGIHTSGFLLAEWVESLDREHHHKNLGELIKKIEKAWVDNNFHLSDLEVQNLLEKKN